MKLSHAGEASRRSAVHMGSRFEAIGSLVLRYGLVLVIGWIGLMKFTAYEPMVLVFYKLFNIYRTINTINVSFWACSRPTNQWC